jgi:hypothetical protein
MMRWWGKPVDQKQVVSTTLKDLQSNYIDFTPASRIKYYRGLQGGALAQTIRIYTEELLMKQPPLSEQEWKLVKRLNHWANGLCNCKNNAVEIKGSSQYLEHAEFQYFSGENVESPFGSFENFKRAVAKRGLAFYKPYLTGKKLFYLRTTKEIPAAEIVNIS